MIGPVGSSRTVDRLAKCAGVRRITVRESQRPPADIDWGSFRMWG